MCIRKASAIGVTAVFAVAVLALPVSACGRHGHHAQSDYHCAVCTVEDCNETGFHIHDETMYCGYNHESGYCDGSCIYSVEPESTGYRGHHHCGRY